MLERVEIEEFRCLSHAVLEPAEHRTLICGPNAAGKTSVLEAIFFLGRGQSFRTADTRRLVRDGAAALTVTGRVLDEGRTIPLGVRWSRSSLEARIAGEPAGGRVALAEQLPVQIIHAELHKLVEEGPSRRRRYLDWGLFHVKPPFLEIWRRYQRALRQRNAGLRQRLGRPALAGWEEELVVSGEAITEMRRLYTLELGKTIRRMCLTERHDPVGDALPVQPCHAQDLLRRHLPCQPLV